MPTRYRRRHQADSRREDNDCAQVRRVTLGNPPSGTVGARVYLAGQDGAGLAAYAAAVSTPGNALYGHYLTPKQDPGLLGPPPAGVSGPGTPAWARALRDERGN